MSKSLQWSDNQLDINNFNGDFLILKSKSKAFLAKVGRAIFQKKYDFIDEVIVTEVEICLKLNALFDTPKMENFKNLNFEESTKQDFYKLPIYFEDHKDWSLVESSVGWNKKEIIAKLSETELTIAMFGFLPGFIYLEGLNPRLHVPRKTVPAKYVKANSIALGGKYVGLYSIASPGGWHVIGRLPISVLEVPNLPPVAMNLGDRIKLHPIEKEEYEFLLTQKISLKKYNE